MAIVLWTSAAVATKGGFYGRERDAAAVLDECVDVLHDGFSAFFGCSAPATR